MDAQTEPGGAPGTPKITPGEPRDNHVAPRGCPGGPQGLPGGAWAPPGAPQSPKKHKNYLKNVDSFKKKLYTNPLTPSLTNPLTQ